MNGSKDRFNISEPTSMIEFVSLGSSKFSPEFIDDEITGFLPIPVIENHRMAKVHGIWQKIRNRIELFNLRFGVTVNIFAEEERSLEIRNLAREM